MVLFDGLEKIRLTNLSPPLKIVKKFKKNVKFGLQRDFNMEIMFNGSDWKFELRICRNKRDVWDNPYIAMYHSPSLSLSLYIYSDTMVLVQVRMQRYLYIISPIRKFKHPIRTVEYDLHIEISLETKFYIFFEFFYYF